MKKTSYKILIADDHQIFIDGLMMIFADVEFIEVIHVATNGQEVLDIFESNEIDLAILDVNMPKPNGFELCQIILEKYKSTKIMILSMYGDDNFMKEFTRLGVMAYVLKNAGKHELLEAVKNVLNGEIYISKDRINENAMTYKVTFEEELTRVISHGVLHLMGYKDKEEVDIQKMRNAENESIKLWKDMFHMKPNNK